MEHALIRNCMHRAKFTRLDTGLPFEVRTSGGSNRDRRVLYLEKGGGPKRDKCPRVA